MKLKKSSLSITVILLLTIFSISSSFVGLINEGNRSADIVKDHVKMISPVKDSIGSKKAFLAAYKVLMSPRCMNCHPSGDIPLQGDDSHLHTQGVKRGLDGKGVYALKCANCHQPQNTPGLNMPPGNPKWHLPPANMKMVFQGKSPHELAAQLKDPNRNGNKTLDQLIDHVTNDQLVLGGWNPGDGRKLPPLSHADFAKNFKAWIDKGAYLP